MQELVQIEEKINEIRKDHPDAENKDPNSTPFVISKRALNGIEFLSDNEIELDDWVNDAKENQWAMKTLKILFALNSTYNKDSWA